MARKKRVKDHTQLEAFRDVIVEYIRASARSPILAHSLAMMPYRIIGAIEHIVNEERWMGDMATRTIDDWMLGAIDGTAIKYSEFGIGLSTPFFDIGTGARAARREFPRERPRAPSVEGLGALIEALANLKTGKTVTPPIR